MSASSSSSSGGNSHPQATETQDGGAVSLTGVRVLSHLFRLLMVIYGWSPLIAKQSEVAFGLKDGHT